MDEYRGLSDDQIKLRFEMTQKMKLRSFIVGDKIILRYPLLPPSEIEVTELMVHEDRKLIALGGDPLPVEKIEGRWKVDPADFILMKTFYADMRERRKKDREELKIKFPEKIKRMEVLWQKLKKIRKWNNVRGT